MNKQDKLMDELLEQHRIARIGAELGEIAIDHAIRLGKWTTLIAILFMVMKLAELGSFAAMSWWWIGGIFIAPAPFAVLDYIALAIYVSRQYEKDS